MGNVLLIGFDHISGDAYGFTIYAVQVDKAKIVYAPNAQFGAESGRIYEDVHPELRLQRRPRYSKPYHLSFLTSSRGLLL